MRTPGPRALLRGRTHVPGLPGLGRTNTGAVPRLLVWYCCGRGGCPDADRDRAVGAHAGPWRGLSPRPAQAHPAGQGRVVPPPTASSSLGVLPAPRTWGYVCVDSAVDRPLGWADRGVVEGSSCGLSSPRLLGSRLAGLDAVWVTSEETSDPVAEVRLAFRVPVTDSRIWPCPSRVHVRLGGVQGGSPTFSRSSPGTKDWRHVPECSSATCVREAPGVQGDVKAFVPFPQAARAPHLTRSHVLGHVGDGCWLLPSSCPSASQ